MANRYPLKGVERSNNARAHTLDETHHFNGRTSGNEGGRKAAYLCARCRNIKRALLPDSL